MVSVILAAALAATPLGYADSLYQAGEYYRAAGEYHRVLYETPSGPVAERARWGLGRAYLRGGRYEQAVRTLESVPAAAAIAPYARFALAQARIARGEREAASAILIGLKGPLAAPAQLQLGRLAAEAGAWNEARLRFEAAGMPELARLAAAEQTRQPYSPLVAGALSIVPGAGHLYLGRPDDALSAFMLPTGSALIAAYYLGRGQTAVGVAFGGLSTIFWGGSIYGAAREAAKINQETVEADLGVIRKAAMGQDPQPE